MEEVSNNFIVLASFGYIFYKNAKYNFFKPLRHIMQSVKSIQIYFQDRIHLTEYTGNKFFLEQ